MSNFYLTPEFNRNMYILFSILLFSLIGLVYYFIRSKLSKENSNGK